MEGKPAPPSPQAARGLAADAAAELAEASGGVRARGAILRAAALAALVVAADRVAKVLVADHIPVGTVRHLVPGLELVHVQNTGVAFSLLAGGGGVVLAVTLAVLAALLANFLRKADRPWLWLPTGLLVGGALGNLIDRVADGSVTDFIKLPHWPAFNLSDVAITVGVIALVLVLEGPAARRRRR
ncbi:MAG TPA: signal peptidase II [Solirubrobacteraceae bacterium]|nr:signal peptidase II [Solirubrobacteraceae bacterium]